MLYTVTTFDDLDALKILHPSFRAKSQPPDVENGPSSDDLELTIFNHEGQEVGQFSLVSSYGAVSPDPEQWFAYMNDDGPGPEERYNPNK